VAVLNPEERSQLRKAQSENARVELLVWLCWSLIVGGAFGGYFLFVNLKSSGPQVEWMSINGALWFGAAGAGVGLILCISSRSLRVGLHTILMFFLNCLLLLFVVLLIIGGLALLKAVLGDLKPN